MAVELPEGVKQLLKKPNFAHLATLMPDGSPHASAVWVHVEDGRILVNTAEGRVKPRNLRKDPRVSISVVDQEQPYLSASIRGRVVEMTYEGADEHIDALAKKYLGADSYPFRKAGEQRIKLVIEPEHVAFGR